MNPVVALARTCSNYEPDSGTSWGGNPRSSPILNVRTIQNGCQRIPRGVSQC